MSILANLIPMEFISMDKNATRKRCIHKLFVHNETLHCALERKCRPCCYKIVLYGRPESLSNQRPEQCPRHNFQRVDRTKARNETSFSSDVKHHIGLYDMGQENSILTVGDGDFSFSFALYRMLRSSKASTIVATSHESRASILATYSNIDRAILSQFEDDRQPFTCAAYGIDATSITHLRLLCNSLENRGYNGKFTHILWNFPCVGAPEGKDGQNDVMEANKALVRAFFQAATHVVADSGQIHLTHKTKPPFSQWNIAQIAQEEGWTHQASMVFDLCLYPGYTNKKVLADASFPITDAVTFVFCKTEASRPISIPLSCCIQVTNELLNRIYDQLAISSTVPLRQNRCTLNRKRKKNMQTFDQKKRSRKVSSNGCRSLGKTLLNDTSCPGESLNSV
uniref:Uncharacterized protein AlNc14C41G3506 n=1 Tax=Albugo laibachii Nc14 TaxID=890382 RepID=F0W9Q2_9STRA|nr:conserved hypothetical protein [Albugo laibachii Nc14]|eukprot:CCA17870.1 conserved hypothetical protein [Albugo laibachii Nc14]